jgi:hypothetical protein
MTLSAENVHGEKVLHATTQRSTAIAMAADCTSVIRWTRLRRLWQGPHHPRPKGGAAVMRIRTAVMLEVAAHLAGFGFRNA